MLPVLAFATALGVLRILELGAHRLSSSRARLTLVAAMVLAMAYPTVVTLRQVRAQIVADHGYYDSFRASLPSDADSAIVFVRYAPSHNDGLSLVRNVPDFRSARIWTAYDRGAENAQLLRLAPRRKAYLFDEGEWAVESMEKTAPNAADLIRYRREAAELLGVNDKNHRNISTAPATAKTQRAMK